jgi:hypothetical protein
MTTRKYSSRSQQSTLSGALTSSATTTTVVSGSALVGGITISAGETFTVVIDPDTALEEIVDIYSASGSPVSTNTLTIVRGRDGSTAVAHSAGAVVRHMAIGRDYREANLHIEATSSYNDGTATHTVHGVTGAVVGTTDTQTLSGKTLTSPTITGTGAIAGTFTGNLTGNVTGNVSGTSGSTTGNAATATALATGRTISLTGDVTGTTGTFDGTGNATMTAAIGTGVIVNADVNAAAAIDKTKISGTAVTVADTGTVTSTMILDGTILNADINASAAIDKTKISGTAITAGDTGTVTSTMIANDTIVNADINTSAQIAYSKINATNSIVDADVNASAAIAWTKIAPSATVSTTELGYLDGVTSAIQTQLDAKLATATAASTYAPLASPALTGVPTAPTAAANTNTTQVATTAYVQTEITDLIAAAPGALDTLDELAAALGDDANFATTVTNALATKLPLAGGTMSGAIAMGTNKITGVGDPTSAQDVATKNYIDTAVLAPSNLTGPITSSGAATSIASQTGTGTKFVVDNTPTLITPVLGVATATSINGTTIPSSKTLVATDSTTYVVPSQTGNTGKYLTTDGTTSTWATIQAGSQVKIEGGTAVTYDFVDFVGMGTNTGTAGTIKVQPLTPTGASTGKRIFTGTTTPSSPVSGDVWVDATASAGADLTTMTIMGAY